MFHLNIKSVWLLTLYIVISIWTCDRLHHAIPRGTLTIETSQLRDQTQLYKSCTIHVYYMSSIAFVVACCTYITRFSHRVLTNKNMLSMILHNHWLTMLQFPNMFAPIRIRDIAWDQICYHLMIFTFLYFSFKGEFIFHLCNLKSCLFHFTNSTNIICSF